jgi:hypothetical protein
MPIELEQPVKVVWSGFSTKDRHAPIPSALHRGPEALFNRASRR